MADHAVTDEGTELRPPPEQPDATAETPSRWSNRLALGVLLLYLVVALPLLVFELGRFHWFAVDEWDYLADRTAFDLGDLFRPHNEHLVTVPVLAFRVLWNLFGIESYRPYQAVIVAVHLACVVLLWLVMRRSAVNAWVATVVAATLVLFGPGAQNIIWAGQIAFTGAVLFGLGQLLLADHDGPIDRRDWLGLGSGLLAVLCSGAAVALVVAVGVFALLRRGWKVALLHTAPLAAIYAAWWLVTTPTVTTSHVGRATPGQYLAFIRTGVYESLMSIGYYRLVGWALLALLVVGLFVAWRPLTMDEFRRVGAAPVALLVGTVVFFAVSGVSRAVLGDELALGSRYLYIGAALALPAFAVAADALVRRWRWTIPILLLFVVGIPGNVGVFDHYLERNLPYAVGVDAEEYFATQRQMVLGVAASPRAEEVPRWVEPDPSTFGTPGVTVGWLLDGRADGRVPEPGELPLVLVGQIRARLGLIQTDEPIPAKARCEVHEEPIDIATAKGDVIGIKTPIVVTLIDQQGTPIALPLAFFLDAGQHIEVYDRNLDVRIQQLPYSPSFEVCMRPKVWNRDRKGG